MLDRARPALEHITKREKDFPKSNYMEVMIMRIQHNIMALNSNRQLGANNSAVAKSLEKLSSGYRINRAGDDAAGLAISEKMRAQIKGLEAATDNSQDAISLVQTAEGGLQEVHSMLNRMTELATKSANGTYTDDVDRKALQDEISALKDEINRIADGTDFNGIKLLDGTMGIGTTGAIADVAADTTANTDAFSWSLSGGEGLEVEIKAAAKTSTGAATAKATWTAGKLTLEIEGDANTEVTQTMIDNAIKNAANAPQSAKDLKVTLDEPIKFTTASGANSVSTLKSEQAARATVTAKSTNNKVDITATAGKAGNVPASLTIQQGAVGVTVDGDGNVVVGLEAGKSYTANDINKMLADGNSDMTVDFAGEQTSTDLAIAKTTLAGGKGLPSDGGLMLQIGDTNDSYNQLKLSIGDMHVNALDLNSVDISTREGASAAMAKIKTAINTVSTSRGKLGAIQNRLEHTINNLGVTTENITSAESRIRDVDMAKEMMNYTKNSVLVQSAQAMLAQANQQPQSILQLLQ